MRAYLPHKPGVPGLTDDFILFWCELDHGVVLGILPKREGFQFSGPPRKGAVALPQRGALAVPRTTTILTIHDQYFKLVLFTY